MIVRIISFQKMCLGWAHFWDFVYHS